MIEKIDRKLNLVIPLPRGPQSLGLYVHSTPIDTRVFDQFWELVGRTMNSLMTGGFGFFAPQYAARVLRKHAKELKEEARVEQGLIAEIRRLTNVFTLVDKKGWALIPLDEALTTALISRDEFDEVENALVFFTCASRSYPRSMQSVVSEALDLCNARTESLDCMEFRNFLTISIKEENTGEKEPASSPLSSTGSVGPDLTSSSIDPSSRPSTSTMLRNGASDTTG